tara:strand:+ start:144 stop:608 length:465 start_codon:yes stop_codon:yes gene_type:complete
LSFKDMKFFFRYLKLLKYKIVRIKDFPESVAIGLAWGAAVSFTPLLGLHLIICYTGTYLMKGNLIAATVGTIVGNPWTFPFFFYISYKFGIFFYFEPLDNYEFNINFLLNNFDDLFFPTLLGCLPIAILIWIITFRISKKILEKRYNEKNKTRN